MLHFTGFNTDSSIVAHCFVQPHVAKVVYSSSFSLSNICFFKDYPWSLQA